MCISAQSSPEPPISREYIQSNKFYAVFAKAFFFKYELIFSIIKLTQNSIIQLIQTHCRSERFPETSLPGVIKHGCS